MSDTETDFKPPENGLKTVPASGVDKRSGPITTIAKNPEPSFPGNFYKWPFLGGILPDDIVDTVIENRKATLQKVAGQYNYVPYYKSIKDPKTGVVTSKVHAGYSHAGKVYQADQLLSDTEAANPKLKAVVERLHVEVGGEGPASSIFTGDGAIITWGTGFGYQNGGMPSAFSDFIQRSSDANRVFLDHGITIINNQLKVVDTESKKVLSHTAAAEYFSGAQPAETKMDLLSIWVQLTEQFGRVAATAQWETTKKKYLYLDKENLFKAMDRGWDPKAICYVVHCSMWGKFVGWEAFLKTDGSLAQVLRAEVDGTRYFTEEIKPPYQEKFLFVPPTGSDGTYPSATMLKNMGAGCMIDILIPWSSEAAFRSAVEPGDVVFEISKKSYYGLRGTQKQYDPLAKYDQWVADHQGLKMSALLKACADRSKENELTKTRDRYIDPSNPKQKKWGLRPVVAMNAELYKNKPQQGKTVMDMCIQAGITPTQNQDQFYEVLKYLQLEKYDEWIAKYHYYPMDDLLNKIKGLSKQEVLNTRDWYASNSNPKKEKFGLRPRIALDAVLHQGEGASSAWILNDCEQAKITEAETPAQLALIKQTLGIA